MLPPHARSLRLEVFGQAFHATTISRVTGTDSAAAGMGIEVVEVGDGRAIVAMTVTADMANGHGVCHGGVIFLLADTAMDHASNSGAGPDAIAFAAHAEIDYVRPAGAGDHLTAEAVVVDQWGRTQLLDATVTNAVGEVVAHFRGRTRSVRRS